MLVATHKPADVPRDDFYLPVHVGHALHTLDLGYQGDDAGENISFLNTAYGELTALYWAWKNLRGDAIGLCHYRRYFAGSQAGPLGSQIMSKAEALAMLAGCDIILPTKRHYWIETIESHYAHAHSRGDLEVLERVVKRMSPTMVPAFRAVFQGRSLSLYNMFFTTRPIFDQYLEWLFPILEETSSGLVGVETRTGYQQRTLGFLGERLLNVWVRGQQDIRVALVPVVNTEGEAKLRKAVRLVGRKAGLSDPAERVKA